MTFDLTEFAEKVGSDMMKAQTLSGGQRGYDFARMTEPERTGYLKAMIDCREHLSRLAASEQSEIIAAGLRIAACELSIFREEKLRAVPQ